MIDPRIIIKANHDRTSITIRVTAIDSPEWTDIVGTKIELSRYSDFSDIFYTNSTTHYKVRAYLEEEAPNQKIYGRVTLTKEDNTTLVKTFNFITPYPVLGTVKNNGTTYIASMRKMDKNGNLSSRDYSNRAVTDMPAHIDIMADETGEMIISNQWVDPILVQNITQGTAQVTIAGGGRESFATIAVNNGDTVRVLESETGKTFRKFSSNGTDGICRGVSAHITVMPSMDKFAKFKDGRIMPNYFFYRFNSNGTLTSLPEGSFDIHKMIYAEATANMVYDAFAYFNWSGALTSLPEGSFDTSNFTDNSLADYYYEDDYGNMRRARHIQLANTAFQSFNQLGALTSLPEGSFDFDNLKMVNGTSFLSQFNMNGALTSLPEGSFGFSSFVNANNYITGITFASFNNNGRLVSLPDGAFHFPKGSILNSTGGFSQFNANGSLTSLPDYSFNFLIKRASFMSFNYGAGITSLPAGSFRFVTDEESLTGGDGCFGSFNRYGALTSLPTGSFNTEAALSLAGGSFSYFNEHGALTSLPEGSFKFDNVASVGYAVCGSFNKDGALKSLPKDSFNFSSLTSIGYGFCAEFNRNGALEYLPIRSFSVNNVTSVYQTSSESWQAFGLFNRDGKLTKSNTDYNPYHIFPSPAQPVSLPAYYYDPDTQTQFTETIGRGNPFKYYQADYFNVVYTQSQAYTTNLADEYLSGQTITFSATATDPEYMVTPTITATGGATITVTDNGDDTFTFIMPQADITISFAVSLRPATITLVAEETGTMVITNQWTTPIKVVNKSQVGNPITVTGNNGSASIAVNVDDEITIAETSANITFRNWSSPGFYYTKRKGIATGVNVHITNMPAMNRFTYNSTGNSVGQFFFCSFCAGDGNKGITSLPAGSFDTSAITNISQQFFSQFNRDGVLTSLPAGSFRLSQITTTQAAQNFFFGFNWGGALTSLPAGSFDTNNITYASSYFFSSFNYQGALTSLPIGSFNTSRVSTIEANVFTQFNASGALISLPAGSFDTSGLTQLYWDCFTAFNHTGALTSLPDGSFDLSNVTGIIGSNIFTQFNNKGNLTSLPAGSFDISGITDTYNNSAFFSSFNYEGALTSLPAGSFDTSNITMAGASFFSQFNYNGALTSLPAGSFDISNITTVKNSFFYGFNGGGGKLTSLPAGSFDTSNITTVDNYFFSGFNSNGGKLTSLPAGSFDISNITTTKTNFFDRFNQSGELTSLPAGSFDTSNITTVSDAFFQEFNRTGKLTSLPAGSFDISNITSATDYFFTTFNYQGRLTSFPAGSFDTSNLTTVGNGAFNGFIGETKGKSQSPWTLPAGSFRFDSLTSVGTNFCTDFHYLGATTSLPAGSFNLDNLITAGDNFFSEFNASGNLTSLPAGSFNLDNLTTVGNSAFRIFNKTGGITALPSGSFGTASLTSVGTYFFYEFNNYGAIVKDTLSYNPNLINPTTSNIVAYYSSPATNETILPGAPFYYKTV